MNMATPSLTIPDEAWNSPHGGAPPWDTMLATVRVNGRLFHVNAWRVFVDPSDPHGIQQAHEDDEDLAAIHNALTADGPWETVEVFGEDYVLILEPFC